MGKFKVGDRVVQDKSIECQDLVKHWNTYWAEKDGKLTNDEFVVTAVTGAYVRYSSRLGGNGPEIGERYLNPAPFKVEAGKFYKTRDGRKVGPLRDDWSDSEAYNYHVERGDLNFALWNVAGTHYLGSHTERDLVAEWDEESAVANDNATPNFKVGDRVLVTHTDYPQIPVGTVTHIVEIDDDGDADLFHKDFIGGLRFYASEFTSAPTHTAIVALIENGQPKPATRPYVHTTEESATKEAERLALLHPGQEFGVYVLAGSKIADEVITKTAVLRAA